MKKRAVFGGTFNPVHKGHINFCLQCQERFNFDEILLIPTNVPPHKPSNELISGEDRLNMLKLAAEKYPYMRPCDLELKNGGKSYTVDTLETLSRRYPNDGLYLLIGSDMLLTLDEWNRYEKILSLSVIAAGARSDGEKKEIYKKRESFGKFKDKIIIVDIDVTELSSTEIRRKIHDGCDVSEFLEPNVCEYIKRRGLYQ